MTVCSSPGFGWGSKWLREEGFLEEGGVKRCDWSVEERGEILGGNGGLGSCACLGGKEDDNR